MATARLGHDDACEHYLRALHVLDGLGPEPRVDERRALLIELAAALDRSGQSEQAGQRYREAAATPAARGDARRSRTPLWALHALGHRSGGESAEVLGPAATPRPIAGGARRIADPAVAGGRRAGPRDATRHDRLPDAETISRWRIRAVDLATAAGDTHAVAVAKLALQDSMWRPAPRCSGCPSSARCWPRRISSGDADLAAEAHLLRAAALIELGDPAGRAELSTYISPRRRAGACAGTVGCPDPAGHPRAAGRPRRRGGAARGTGAPAGPGDR